jgi:NifU-like protein involved in Fe-S cluster formation
MKTILLLIAAAGVAGCGLDVASSAATAGSIKKRELEQAQKTMHNAQQKLDATMQQVQAREREDSKQE